MSMDIHHLHATYCSITGLQISLDYWRERCWFEWAKHGWGVPELTLVVNEIKRGIKERRRNRGALKFSNLVQSSDLFEEELALARQAQRVKQRAVHVAPNRAAALKATGREPNPMPVAFKPVSEVALKILSDFRKANV